MIGKQHLFILFIASSVFFSFNVLAKEKENIAGYIKTLEGPVSIVRAGQSLPVKVKDAVLKDDILKTGSGGSLGVVLKDETSISLGPESQMKIDEFVYDPGNENVSLVTQMMKGSAAYLSGKIGKISPDAVRIKTPLATIGIRGTKFLIKLPEEEEEEE